MSQNKTSKRLNGGFAGGSGVSAAIAQILEIEHWPRRELTLTALSYSLVLIASCCGPESKHSQDEPESPPSLVGSWVDGEAYEFGFRATETSIEEIDDWKLRGDQAEYRLDTSQKPYLLTMYSPNGDGEPADMRLEFLDKNTIRITFLETEETAQLPPEPVVFHRWEAIERRIRETKVPNTTPEEFVKSLHTALREKDELAFACLCVDKEDYLEWAVATSGPAEELERHKQRAEEEYGSLSKNPGQRLSRFREVVAQAPWTEVRLGKIISKPVTDNRGRVLGFGMLRVECECGDKRFILAVDDVAKTPSGFKSFEPSGALHLESLPDDEGHFGYPIQWPIRGNQ